MPHNIPPYSAVVFVTLLYSKRSSKRGRQRRREEGLGPEGEGMWLSWVGEDVAEEGIARRFRALRTLPIPTYLSSIRYREEEVSERQKDRARERERESDWFECWPEGKRRRWTSKGPTCSGFMAFLDGLANEAQEAILPNLLARPGCKGRTKESVRFSFSNNQCNFLANSYKYSKLNI